MNQLKESAGQTTECTNAEQRMLRELEIVQRYMQRITFRVEDNSFGNDAFHAQASILARGIIKFMDNFTTAVRNLHDRCEQA